MKTKTIKLLGLATLLLSITLTSCSSNEDDISQSEELSEVVMQEFVEDIQVLSVPSGLSSSSNQYAQQANAQFESLKALGTSFAVLFNVPPSALSNKEAIKTFAKSSALNTKTYTWLASGTTVEYSITEESDRYSFSYYITSTDFTGKFMDGYQLKDGSYAESRMYFDNQAISTIKWWVNANSTKIELVSDDFNMTLESNKVDNSGTLKVSSANDLIGAYSWNSDGSGTYTNHLTNETFTW